MKIVLLFVLFISFADSIFSVCASYTDISSTLTPTSDITVSNCSCVVPSTFTTPYSVKSLTIANGGTLALCGTNTSINSGLYIVALNRVEIQNGGTISANASNNIPNVFRRNASGTNFGFSTNSTITSDQAACLPTWVTNLGASEYIGGNEHKAWVRPGSVLNNDASNKFATNCATEITPVKFSAPGGNVNGAFVMRKNIPEARSPGALTTRDLNADITTIPSSFCSSTVLGTTASIQEGDRPIYTLVEQYYGTLGLRWLGGIEDNPLHWCSRSDIGTGIHQVKLTVGWTFNYHGSGNGGAVGCRGGTDASSTDNPARLGGNGGSFIYIQASSFVIRNGGSIESNGGNGINATVPNNTAATAKDTNSGATDTIDIYGGTGGGGGGTMFIKAVDITLENNSLLTVQGGMGGLKTDGVYRAQRDYRKRPYQNVYSAGDDSLNLSTTTLEPDAGFTRGTQDAFVVLIYDYPMLYYDGRNPNEVNEEVCYDPTNGITPSPTSNVTRGYATLDTSNNGVEDVVQFPNDYVTNDIRGECTDPFGTGLILCTSSNFQKVQLWYNHFINNSSNIPFARIQNVPNMGHPLRKPQSSTLDASPGGRGVDGSIILVYSNSYVNNGATIQAVRMLKGSTVGTYAPYVLQDSIVLQNNELVRNTTPLSRPRFELTSIIKNNSTLYNSGYINYSGMSQIAQGLSGWMVLSGFNYNLPIDRSYVTSLYFPFDRLQIQLSLQQGPRIVGVCSSDIAANCSDTTLASTQNIQPGSWSTNVLSRGLFTAVTNDISENRLNIGTNFYPSLVIPLYALDDGLAPALTVIASSPGYYRNNPISLSLNAVDGIDQYAPCDHQLHSCFFTSSTLNRLSTNTYLGNTLVNFDFRLNILDNPGSGLSGVNNIHIIPLSYSENGQLRDANGVLLPDLDATPSQLGKTCNVLLAPGGRWANVPKATFSYNTDFDAQSSTKRQVLRDLMLATLSSVNNGLSCQNNDCNGTLYLVSCFRDTAGNWSNIIEYNSFSNSIRGDFNNDGNVTNDSNLLSIATYKGIPNPRTLRSFEYSTSSCPIELENTFTCYNSSKISAVSLQRHLPTFIRRIFIDSPQPDLVDDCNTDPCPVAKLINVNGFTPKFIRISEVASDIRIAYSPVNWTNQDSVIAGVRLPQDYTGIKQVYYYKGVTPPTTNSTFVTAVSVSCDTVIRDNNQVNLTPTNWVNYCFRVTNLRDNETLYIDLEDNAGNRATSATNLVSNNIVTSLASRRLFIDRTKPLPPSRLDTDKNYTPATDPTLSFKGGIDTEPNSGSDAMSEVTSYKICYWQEASAFTYDSLLKVNIGNPGACPQATDINGGYTNSVVVNQSSFSLQSVKLPALSCCYKWNIVAYSIDTAGNYSDPSSIFQFVNTDDIPRISFTREKFDYIVGGVSPRRGTTGLYTFKVRYTDLADRVAVKRPPSRSTLWIDINGNNQYEDSEKLIMTRRNDNTQYGDNDL